MVLTLANSIAFQSKDVKNKELILNTLLLPGKKKTVSCRGTQVAICGCGAIAQQHVAYLEQISDVNIRACWNRREELYLAELMKARTNAEYSTDDYMKIANDPYVDVVYICNWHNERLKLLEAFARAGKAVFMEKPLTLLPDELREMNRILKRYPIFFQSGYKIRFHSLIEELRRKIKTPNLIVSQVSDVQGSEMTPGSVREIGGGHIVCQGVYAAESLRVLAGSEPVSVSGMQNTSVDNNCIHGSLTASFRFANGVIGNIIVTDSGMAGTDISKFFVEVFGDETSIVLSERYSKLTIRDVAGKEKVIFASEDGFQKQSVAFFHSLKNKQSAPCDFREGAIPSIMIFKAIESAERKVEVPIDVDRWLNAE